MQAVEQRIAVNNAMAKSYGFTNDALWKQSSKKALNYSVQYLWTQQLRPKMTANDVKMLWTTIIYSQMVTDDYSRFWSVWASVAVKTFPFDRELMFS